MHGRLPWPGPDELTLERRRVYDLIADGPRVASQALSPVTGPGGRLEGPFNAMLLSPAVGASLQGVGASLRYGSGLTSREREVAILCVAASWRSDFEWVAHVELARAAGLSDAAIEALATGAAPGDLEGDEPSVHAVVTALLVEADLSDEEWQAASTILGVPKIFELVTLVGYYQLLSLSLRVFRTPLPPGLEAPWSASAPVRRRPASPGTELL
jgi:4-carboxymuconolactone decarboxylase